MAADDRVLALRETYDESRHRTICMAVAEEARENSELNQVLDEMSRGELREYIQMMSERRTIEWALGIYFSRYAYRDRASSPRKEHYRKAALKIAQQALKTYQERDRKKSGTTERT